VVHQTSDKGYIIGGGLAGFAILRIGAFLMKTDSIGTPLWTRRFTNRGGISSVSQTPDGGFVFSGRAVEPEGKGFYFTRADASGGSCNASILSQSLEDTLIVSESALPGLMADSLPLSLSSVTFAQIDTGGAITGCGGLKVAPIAEKEGYDIKIYPNPSTGKFEINIISEKYIGAVTIKVTNIIGTVVMTEEVKDGDRAFRKDIDLSALQKGIYFVVVADHEMQTARKVIVN
jgi:hypothetical protein